MNGLFSRRKFSVVLAAAAALAALCAAISTRAQVMSGGTLSLQNPFFAAGGGGDTLTGGAINLIHSLGDGSVTPMNGGTMTLTPGPDAGQPSATPNITFVHAFPVPFKPSLGQDRITFRGLSTNATIKIYTIAGQLVQTLTKDDPTTADMVWLPVTNSAGQALASGVYLYAVSGEGGTANGKLMIIR